jgi:hypothetical protein
MGAERQGFKNWADANGDSNAVKSMNFKFGAGLEPMKNEKETFTEEQKSAGLEKLAELTSKLEVATDAEKERLSREILNMITDKSAKNFVEMKVQANA